MYYAGDNQEVNRTRIILEKDADGVEDAILIIEHVQMSDRNMYNCTARNQATEYGHDYEPAMEGTYVRVKGMHSQMRFQGMALNFYKKNSLSRLLWHYCKILTNFFLCFFTSLLHDKTKFRCKQNRKISCFMAIFVYLRRSSRLMWHYLSV